MKKFLSVFLMLGLVLVLGACQKDEEPVKVGRVHYAGDHDTGFKVVAVAIQGDKIVDVSIDEYYLFDEASGAKDVTLGKGSFKQNYPEGKVLGSKRENSAIYSPKMEVAGSTQTIEESFSALEEYCIGMTVSELEDLLNDHDADSIMDVETGSTLTSNHDYLKGVLLAAKDAQ